MTKDDGKFNRRGKTDPTDRPALYPIAYRAPYGEVQNLHGEWNVLELYADGDNIKYLVNGPLANEGVGAKPSRGKILFQSEGAEVFFLKIELDSTEEGVVRAKRAGGEADRSFAGLAF